MVLVKCGVKMQVVSYLECKIWQRRIILSCLFLYKMTLWLFRGDSLIFYPFSWFGFNPSFICVSVVDSWKSFYSCWLYCLVKRLSFELWSVGLSWSSFGYCWNRCSLCAFIVTHWFISLRGISFIISLRNVFLIISLTSIKFPMSWN